MSKRIKMGRRIALDTCHILDLFWPNLNRRRWDPLNKLRRFFYRDKIRRLGIFKGATVLVSDAACREAYLKAGVTREQIRAIHEEFGATVDFTVVTREMGIDADEMERRHDGLHDPDSKILAHAKHSVCALCTRDSDLAAVAPLEGVACINPDNAYGTGDQLYEWDKPHRSATRPFDVAACPAAPAKERRRPPRRACPSRADPRYRDLPGYPARGRTGGAPPC